MKNFERKMDTFVEKADSALTKGAAKTKEFCNDAFETSHRAKILTEANVSVMKAIAKATAEKKAAAKAAKKAAKQAAYDKEIQEAKDRLAASRAVKA